jgi:hypothetical protein
MVKILLGYPKKNPQLLRHEFWIVYVLNRTTVSGMSHELYL